MRRNSLNHGETNPLSLKTAVVVNVASVILGSSHRDTSTCFHSLFPLSENSRIQVFDSGRQTAGVYTRSHCSNRCRPGGIHANVSRFLSTLAPPFSELHDGPNGQRYGLRFYQNITARGVLSGVQSPNSFRNSCVGFNCQRAGPDPGSFGEPHDQLVSRLPGNQMRTQVYFATAPRDPSHLHVASTKSHLFGLVPGSR